MHYWTVATKRVDMMSKLLTESNPFKANYITRTSVLHKCVTSERIKVTEREAHAYTHTHTHTD